ncbi:putative PWWP domain-containing protein [Helianthus annuus]|nr:putative PWWP domain-containing protein [Helianthus annuus]
MGNEFNEGDLVWAKVIHHPWWPGIIYHEPPWSKDGKEVEFFAIITKIDDLHFVEKKDDIGKQDDMRLTCGTKRHRTQHKRRENKVRKSNGLLDFNNPNYSLLAANNLNHRQSQPGRRENVFRWKTPFWSENSFLAGKL